MRVSGKARHMFLAHSKYITESLSDILTIMSCMCHNISSDRCVDIAEWCRDVEIYSQRLKIRYMSG